MVSGGSGNVLEKTDTDVGAKAAGCFLAATEILAKHDEVRQETYNVGA